MDSLNETRRAWHAVAELVLAGPEHRATGEIALRVRPGGFATTTAPDLRVEGGFLVAGDRRVPIDGSTPAALAAAVGVDAGKPKDLYHDGSGVEPDEVLTLDEAAAATLADAFERGYAALRALAPAETPILWPEHFDVGITVDAVNYGVSAGDGYLAVPYAYVGPHTRREGELRELASETSRQGRELASETSRQFWNAPFGAARPVADLPDLLAFFVAGRDAVAAGG
jgi:hypothetical protein